MGHGRTAAALNESAELKERGQTTLKEPCIFPSLIPDTIQVNQGKS